MRYDFGSDNTAGMAPAERAALMRLVVGIARRSRIGVLFTEHDMDAVFAHADRILVLVRGEVGQHLYQQPGVGIIDAQPDINDVRLAGEAPARAVVAELLARPLKPEDDRDKRFSDAGKAVSPAGRTCMVQPAGGITRSTPRGIP